MIPLVDKTVPEMTLYDELSHENKMSLVNILNYEVFIDGKIHYVNNAIRMFISSRWWFSFHV